MSFETKSLLCCVYLLMENEEYIHWNVFHVMTLIVDLYLESFLCVDYLLQLDFMLNKLLRNTME